MDGRDIFVRFALQQEISRLEACRDGMVQDEILPEPLAQRIFGILIEYAPAFMQVWPEDPFADTDPIEGREVNKGMAHTLNVSVYQQLRDTIKALVEKLAEVQRAGYPVQGVVNVDAFEARFEVWLQTWEYVQTLGTPAVPDSVPDWL